MAKVIKRIELAIPIYRMRDGDVAEIVSWPMGKEFIGTVVQRHNYDLFVIGKGEYYPDFFNEINAKLEKFTVRFLTKGTLIEL